MEPRDEPTDEEPRRKEKPSRLAVKSVKEDSQSESAQAVPTFAEVTLLKAAQIEKMQKEFAVRNQPAHPDTAAYLRVKH